MHYYCRADDILQFVIFEKLVIFAADNHSNRAVHFAIFMSIRWRNLQKMDYTSSGCRGAKNTVLTCDSPLMQIKKNK